MRVKVRTHRIASTGNDTRGSNVNDEAIIKELLEGRYASCLNTEDADGYLGLYGDDVMWAVPNMPDATTKDQIGSLLSRIFSKVSQTIEVEVDDLLIEGSVAIAMATATGSAARKPDGDPQPLALRVMWVLRRSGDTWQIIRQVGTPKPAA
jgi:uncharacterized protein (TIGR02246 family)